MKVGRCGLQNAWNWSPLFARVDDHRRKKCENWTYPFFLFVVLSLLDGSVCGGPLEWPNKLFHLTAATQRFQKTWKVSFWPPQVTVGVRWLAGKRYAWRSSRLVLS